MDYLISKETATDTLHIYIPETDIKESKLSMSVVKGKGWMCSINRKSKLDWNDRLNPTFEDVQLIVKIHESFQQYWDKAEEDDWDID